MAHCPHGTHTLHGFTAWLLQQGLSETTAAYYATRVRAALWGAGVVSDDDIATMTVDNAFDSYLASLGAVSRSQSKSALRRFVAYAATQDVVIPEVPRGATGRPPRTATIAADVAGWWRTTHDAVLSSGVATHGLTWKSVRVNASGRGVFFGGGGEGYQGNATAGAALSLHAWATAQNGGEVPPPEAPVEPRAFLAWLPTQSVAHA